MPKTTLRKRFEKYCRDEKVGDITRIGMWRFIEEAREDQREEDANYIEFELLQLTPYTYEIEENPLLEKTVDSFNEQVKLAASRIRSKSDNK